LVMGRERGRNSLGGKVNEVAWAQQLSNQEVNISKARTEEREIRNMFLFLLTTSQILISSCPEGELSRLKSSDSEDDGKYRRTRVPHQLK